jgi:hypothetical protein
MGFGFYLPECTKSRNQKKKILLDKSQYWRGLAHIDLNDSQAAQNRQTNNESGRQSQHVQKGHLRRYGKKGLRPGCLMDDVWILHTNPSLKAHFTKTLFYADLTNVNPG